VDGKRTQNEELNILTRWQEVVKDLIDLDVEEQVIFKYILRNRMGNCAMDSSETTWSPVENCCEHESEPPRSVKFL